MIDRTESEYNTFIAVLVNPTIEIKPFCGETITEHYVLDVMQAIKLVNDVTNETEYKTL